MDQEDQTPTPVIPQVIPKPDTHWVLHAHAYDWQIKLQMFLMDHVAAENMKDDKVVDQKVAILGFDKKDGSYIYYLNRAYFPEELIAHLLGKTPEQLRGVEDIHLRELKGPDGKPAQATWETPTVNYWGRS